MEYDWGMENTLEKEADDGFDRVRYNGSRVIKQLEV